MKADAFLCVNRVTDRTAARVASHLKAATPAEAWPTSPAVSGKRPLSNERGPEEPRPILQNSSCAASTCVGRGSAPPAAGDQETKNEVPLQHAP